MVAQLEHQFRLGRLSPRIMVLLSGLSFFREWKLQVLEKPMLIDCFCVSQPMMGSMRALAVVIQQASAKHFVGSGVLNLLQSQVDSCFGYFVVLELAFLLCVLILKTAMPRLKRWLVIIQ